MWSPPDPGKGVEGGSADVAGRRGGLESGWVLVGSWRAPKIMGARPHIWESTHNNGGAPSSCGRFGDFLLFFMQLRVDNFHIRSR